MIFDSLQESSITDDENDNEQDPTEEMNKKKTELCSICTKNFGRNTVRPVNHSCNKCVDCNNRTYTDIISHISDTHQCSICQKIFRSRSIRDHHMMSEHNHIENLECTICKKKCKSKKGLAGHMKKYHNENNKPCSVCNKTFRSIKYLEEHNEKCGRRTQCLVCYENFTSRDLKMEHIASSHKEVKIHYCSKCSAKFLLQQTLKNHISNIHEKVSVECSICGKNNLSKKSLKRHILHVHEGKKTIRYKCSLCSYTSTQKFVLKNHTETVHEGKTYQCPHCTQEFNSQNKLEGHIALTHDKTKLFSCSICSKEYRVKRYLSEHILLVHEKKINHLCPLCGHVSSNSGVLKSHMKFKVI